MEHSTTLNKCIRNILFREVTLPASSPYRDILALGALLLFLFAYHLEDMYFTILPKNDLAGSIAGFTDFKRQWFSEGTLPLWLPTWFTGMVNLHSLSEFLLVFPFSWVMPAVAAYKAASLGLVAVGTVGIFRLLRQFGIDRGGAFVGGLVFFSHPLMMVESRFFGHLAFLMTLAILPFYLLEVRHVVNRPDWAWPLVRASLLLGLLFSLHATMAVMVSLMTVVVVLVLHRADDRGVGLTRVGVRIASVLVAAFVLSSFANLPLWIESQANLALFAGGKTDGVSRVLFPVPSPLFFFDRMGVLLESEGTRAAMGDTPLLMQYPISAGGCYLGWSVFLLTFAGALVKRKPGDGQGLFLLALVWLLMAWMALGDRSFLGSSIWLMEINADGAAWGNLLVSVSLGVWAVVLARRGWRATDRSPSRKIICVTVFVVAIIIFPGFPVLQTMVPFFSKIRAPSQFLVPAFILLPVLAGAAVHELRLHIRSYTRMAATFAIGILLVVDFYPYNPASFLDVSGFEWPMLEKMTAFLRQNPDKERAIYLRGYSPAMDYAISSMANKGAFSYWLNWAAPRCIGAYRERIYDAWIAWLNKGDAEQWKALMAVANIRLVIVPCFYILMPAEPSLEKIYHNLLFDVYALREALGEWQVYPADAIPCTDSDTWDRALVSAFRQRRALVDETANGAVQASDSCTLRSQPPGKILQSERPASTCGSADVDFVQSGILMWSESYHPYWRVQIDGKPSRLLRVNHAFVGVRVPAGRHRVSFEFGPYPWRWIGAIVSVASLAALFLTAYLISRKGQSDRR